MVMAGALFSCAGEEKLTPSKIDGVADKFAFPQGTSAADAIFEQIYDRYGVKVIYKDFTDQDIRRSWVKFDAGETYTWSYVDASKLLGAAETLRDKVFGLLPDDVVRAGVKSTPYIYLVDNLEGYYNGQSSGVFVLYPVRALDGITINLQMDAPADSYTHKVYYPAKVASEIFSMAFREIGMTLPESYYKGVGPITYGLWSYAWVADGLAHNNVASNPELYWARQGQIPKMNLNGNLVIGKKSSHVVRNAQSGNGILFGQNLDVPDCFLYLCLDPNWRTFAEVPGVSDNTLTGVYYNCPRLIDRLETFTAAMADYDIDFADIQTRLYGGGAVSTDPARVYQSGTTAGDPGKYIYYNAN